MTTIQASISDGMSRDAGGSTTITRKQVQRISCHIQLQGPHDHRVSDPTRDLRAQALSVMVPGDNYEWTLTRLGDRLRWSAHEREVFRAALGGCVLAVSP